LFSSISILIELFHSHSHCEIGSWFVLFLRTHAYWLPVQLLPPSTSHQSTQDLCNRRIVGRLVSSLQGVQAHSHSVGAPTISYVGGNCKLWGIVCPLSVMEDMEAKFQTQKTVFEQDIDDAEASLAEYERRVEESLQQKSGYQTAASEARNLIVAVKAAIEKATEDRQVAKEEHDKTARSLVDTIEQLMVRMQAAQGHVQQAVDLLNGIEAPTSTAEPTLLQTGGLIDWDRVWAGAAKFACYVTGDNQWHNEWTGTTFYCKPAMDNKQANMQGELNELDVELKDLVKLWEIEDKELAAAMQDEASAKHLMEQKQAEHSTFAQKLKDLKEDCKSQAAIEETLMKELHTQLEQLQGTATEFSAKLAAAAESVVQGQQDEHVTEG